eukprot:6410092-Prymnesium_polylepis.1
MPNGGDRWCRRVCVEAAELCPDHACAALSATPRTMIKVCCDSKYVCAVNRRACGCSYSLLLVGCRMTCHVC